MKTFFTRFFVTLGVIFFILLLAGAYFVIADPLGLKPLLLSESSVTTESTQTDTNDTVSETTPGTDKNPALSETQEKALEIIGIDPAKLPTTITPEQTTCFEAALGAERVAEIKAGDTPTPIEYYKAKSCVGL